MFLAGMAGGAADRASQNIQADKKREQDRKDFQDKAIFQTQMDSWDEEQKLLKKLQYLPDDQKVIALGKYFGTDIEKLPSAEARERAIQEGITLLPDIMNKMQSAKMPRFGQKPSSYQSPFSLGAKHLYNTIGVQPVPNKIAGAQAIGKYSAVAQSTIQSTLDLSKGDDYAKMVRSQEYIKKAKSSGANPNNYPHLKQAETAAKFYEAKLNKSLNTNLTVTNSNGTKTVVTVGPEGDILNATPEIGKRTPITVSAEQAGRTMTLYKLGLNKAMEEKGVALSDFVLEAFEGKSGDHAKLSRITALSMQIKQENPNMPETKALMTSLEILNGVSRDNPEAFWNPISLSSDHIMGNSVGAKVVKYQVNTGELPPGVEVGNQPQQQPQQQQEPIPKFLRVRDKNGNIVKVEDPAMIKTLLASKGIESRLVDGSPQPSAPTPAPTNKAAAVFNAKDDRIRAGDLSEGMSEFDVKDAINAYTPLPGDTPVAANNTQLDPFTNEPLAMPEEKAPKEQESVPIREGVDYSEEMSYGEPQEIVEPEGYVPEPEPEDMMPGGTEDMMYTVEEFKDFKTAERFSEDVVKMAEDVSSGLTEGFASVKQAMDDVIEAAKAIPFAGGEPKNKYEYGESGLDRFTDLTTRLLDEMENNLGYTTKPSSKPEPLKNKREYGGESGMDRLVKRIDLSIAKLSEEFGYTPPKTPKRKTSPKNKYTYGESGMDRLTFKIYTLMNAVKFSNKLMEEK